MKTNKEKAEILIVALEEMKVNINIEAQEIKVTKNEKY